MFWPLIRQFSAAWLSRAPWQTGQVCEVVNCSKTARLRSDIAAASLRLMYMRVKRSTSPSYFEPNFAQGDLHVRAVEQGVQLLVGVVLRSACRCRRGPRASTSSTSTCRP